MCVPVQIGIALDETVTSGDLEDLMAVFDCSEEVKVQWVGPGHSRRGCSWIDHAENYILASTCR